MPPETKIALLRKINITINRLALSHIVPVAGFGKGGRIGPNGHADYITNESKSVCCPFIRFKTRYLNPPSASPTNSSGNHTELTSP